MYGQDPRKNAEGYYDMTAYEAERRIEMDYATMSDGVYYTADEKTIKADDMNTDKIKDRKNKKNTLPPEEWRFRNFISIVMRAAALSGLEIQNRIIVKDKKTGRVFE